MVHDMRLIKKTTDERIATWEAIALAAYAGKDVNALRALGSWAFGAKCVAYDYINASAAKEYTRIVELTERYIADLHRFG